MMGKSFGFLTITAFSLGLSACVEDVAYEDDGFGKADQDGKARIATGPLWCTQDSDCQGSDGDTTDLCFSGTCMGADTPVGLFVTQLSNLPKAIYKNSGRSGDMLYWNMRELSGKAAIDLSDARFDPVADAKDDQETRDARMLLPYTQGVEPRQLSEAPKGEHMLDTTLAGIVGGFEVKVFATLGQEDTRVAKHRRRGTHRFSDGKLTRRGASNMATLTHNALSGDWTASTQAIYDLDLSALQPALGGDHFPSHMGIALKEHMMQAGLPYGWSAKGGATDSDGNRTLQVLKDGKTIYTFRIGRSFTDKGEFGVTIGGQTFACRDDSDCRQGLHQPLMAEYAKFLAEAAKHQLYGTDAKQLLEALHDGPMKTMRLIPNASGMNASQYLTQVKYPEAPPAAKQQQAETCNDATQILKLPANCDANSPTSCHAKNARTSFNFASATNANSCDAGDVRVCAIVGQNKLGLQWCRKDGTRFNTYCANIATGQQYDSNGQEKTQVDVTNVRDTLKTQGLLVCP